MEYIEIGQIVNTQGLKGEVKVMPFTDAINRFDNLKKIYIEINSSKQLLEIEKVRYVKNMVILKFKGKDKIEDDFRLVLAENTAADSLMKEMSKRFGVEHLLQKHPYDLSGGELQKCALCKLMLSQPQVLLLDEPTKGFDAAYKLNLAQILRELQSEGKTVISVTHDVEFAAAVSDRCALFFDGGIISEDTPNAFFSENNFYTTAASRISRDLFKGAVLCEEVAACCKGDAR